MKRLPFYLIALACLGTSIVSCSKEEQYSNGEAPVFTASIENNSKTSFDPNGAGLVWSSSDEQVAIYGTSGPSTYNVTPATNPRQATLEIAADQSAPGNGPYKAIYPVGIATTSTIVTIPKVQTSFSGELTGYPMYAQTTGTSDLQLKFKNLCSVLKITMQKANTSISKIQIITDNYINGDFAVDITDNTQPLTYDISYTGSNGRRDAKNHSKVTTLTFNGNVSIASSHDFYVYLPAGTYNYFQIKVYDQNGDCFTRTTTSGITFNRSQYNYLTIPTSAINFKPGDLLGEFTAGSDGHKVSFSKGNLLQNGNTYKFADLQYNKTEDGYTYLFNWSDNEYSSTMNERGANPISNGGNTANMWRTLRQDEWSWILSWAGSPQGGRTNSSWRWTLVKVNGIGGMIIFPDGFSDSHWPLDDSKKPTKLSQSANTNWNSQNYSLDQWNALEALGCVFLPTTGYKESSNHSVNYTSSGYYWSCSPKYANDNNRAYYTYFTQRVATFPTSQEGVSLDHEMAIRLVKDVTTSTK